MKIALKDVDPTNVLKHCEFLVVDYKPSPLGQTYGLYSLGTKVLVCLKNEIKTEGFNLELISNHFKEITQNTIEFMLLRYLRVKPSTFQVITVKSIKCLLNSSFLDFDNGKYFLS